MNKKQLRSSRSRMQRRLNLRGSGGWLPVTAKNAQRIFFWEKSVVAMGELIDKMKSKK